MIEYLREFKMLIRMDENEKVENCGQQCGNMCTLVFMIEKKSYAN